MTDSNLTDSKKPVVCFRKADDGRSIILPTNRIGQNPIQVRQKIVEQAEEHGFYLTAADRKSTSMTTLPHMRHLGGGICIISCDEDNTVRIAASSPGKIPPVVSQIIQGAFCNARECTHLGGVSS